MGVGIIKTRARQKGQGEVKVSDVAEDRVTLLPDAITFHTLGLEKVSALVEMIPLLPGKDSLAC